MEAAALCQERGTDVLFLLCGKGELLEHYQQLVKEKELKNVILPGWVNQTDIADIGYLSDIGLMAYKKNENFDMQMPNKFSESLSLGLAVMLQPTGVMLDVITKNECGLHYENAEELYQALKRLSDNRELLDRMKKNSRDLFERAFDVSNVYKEFGEYILEMAEERKR